MPTAIQFHPDRGEIRVGGTVFDCVATPDGALVVNGQRVRAITLGERDRVVTLSRDDSHRARRVARLIGDVAFGSGDSDGRVDGDDELRAALEAVALHLAGAEMPGALARTTLLVTRAMGGFGDAVTTLPAAEADRLAETLDPAPRADGGYASPDDSGWTTISYDTTASGRNPDGTLSARDHLAALLLARDHPVGDELAALLLGAAPAADRASSVGEPGAPSPAEAAAATDRWAEQPSPQPTEAADAGRWARATHTDPATSVVAHRRPGNAPPAAHLPPSTAPAPTAELRHAARSAPTAIALPGTWSPVRRPPAQRGALHGPADGLGPGAWPGPSARPDRATTADDGSWGERDAGSGLLPRLASRRVRAADPFDDAHRSSPATPHPGTTGPLGPRDPGSRPHDDLDLDAVAVALHRAADLRGVR